MRSTKTHNRKISSETTDHELMNLLVNGQDSALDEIMTRYKMKLFGFIVRYVQNEDTAADLLQEVFIRVYFKSETFKPDHQFSTWIYRIAINLCRDWSRKEKIRGWLSLDSPDDKEKTETEQNLKDPGSDTEKIVMGELLLETVQREIGRLPHKWRAALILHAIEGYPQTQCATLLGVSLKTVESRIYRARKRLSERLKHYF